MRTSQRVAILIAAFAVFWPPRAADARPPKKEAEVDPKLQRGREAFKKGTEAVRATQWAEALAQFEKAAAIKESSIVTFNIGYCQRALGRYLLARASFRKALKSAEGLPQVQLDEARAFVKEINGHLAHVKVTLDPPQARIAIDGRPLVPVEGKSPPVVLAGIAPSGAGKPAPGKTFEIIIDPGPHLIHVSRPGHEDVLINKSFRRGAKIALPLKLSELPATIHVESNLPRAIVTIDDRDVGMAPIDITRQAGRYRIQVLKKGYVTYDSTVTVSAGQKANLMARLTPEKESLVQKWWFWGGTAAVVAGGITAAYFLTRPDPQPAPYERGTLNWLAQP